jgi:hypothetical protein
MSDHGVSRTTIRWFLFRSGDNISYSDFPKKKKTGPQKKKRARVISKTGISKVRRNAPGFSDGTRYCG